MNTVAQINKTYRGRNELNGAEAFSLLLTTLGGFLQNFYWVLYACFFFALMFSKSKFAQSISDFVGSSSTFVEGFCILVFIPALILSCIKNTRIIGSVLFVLIGDFSLFCLTCSCAIYVYKFLGLFGLIAGTILFGYGIIATALFWSVVSGGWGFLIVFAVCLLFSVGMRQIGWLVFNKYVQVREGEIAKSEDALVNGAFVSSVEGKLDPASPEYGTENVHFTREKADAARERLRQVVIDQGEGIPIKSPPDQPHGYMADGTPVTLLGSAEDGAKFRLQTGDATVRLPADAAVRIIEALVPFPPLNDDHDIETRP